MIIETDRLRKVFGDVVALDEVSLTVTAGTVLQLFDLTDAAARRVKTYSGGMKRRLDMN